MVLYIKNMVSLRCIMKVKEELEKIGLQYNTVELGFAEIAVEILAEQYELLKNNLQSSGLELLENKKNILAERIKNVVVQIIFYNNETPIEKYSDFISKQLNYDYTYLANVFSEVRGITLQQFIILNKVERVKELLLYDELTLKEIAYKLDYSSIAHLSTQFKNVTGMTPSLYRQLGQKQRVTLENL